MNDQQNSTEPFMPVDSNKSAEEFGLMDIVEAIAQNLRLILLGSMSVGILALGISFLISPTFTAVTKFLPPQQQQSGAASLLQSLGAVGSLAGAAGGLKNPVDQYISFLKTRTVQDALVKRFSLQDYYKKDLMQDARRELENATRVATGKDNIIVLEFDDTNPKFASDMANAYVEELKSLINGLALTDAQQRRRFFEKQMLTTKENLVKAELALGASGVGISTLNVSPAIAVDAIAKLRAQITATEVRLAAMRSYLTDAAPELRKALSELTTLRAQLAEAEKDQPSTGSSKAGGEYVAKLREFKYQETLFDLFARQYEIARVDESREGSVVQVIDLAFPPERKSKPQKLIIAMSAALTTAVLLVFYILSAAMVRSLAFSNSTNAMRVLKIKKALRRSLFGTT